MQEIDLKLLLESGAHFGHKTNKWHPGANKFIYKAVGDIHIIDLTITKDLLEKALTAVKEMVSQGKEVLFIGTKRQASSIVKEEAEKVNAPYINTRWIGGFITNWEEIKKNIDKLNTLEEDLKDKDKMAKFTKREVGLMDRERGKLTMIYGGVKTMKKPPNMLFVVDARKEKTAIQEAVQNKNQIVAIVDTNTNPSDIDYPIPANDDATGSIQYITKFIAEAYNEGKQEWQKKKEQEKEAKAKDIKDTKKK